MWTLWLFGLLTFPAGIALWHNQGPHFGLGKGKAESKVAPGVVVTVLVACAVLLLLGFLVGQ